MFSHTNAQRRACSASSEGMLSFEIVEGVSHGMPSRIQLARGRPLPRERLFFGRCGSECQHTTEQFERDTHKFKSPTSIAMR